MEYHISAPRRQHLGSACNLSCRMEYLWTTLLILIGLALCFAAGLTSAIVVEAYRRRFNHEYATAVLLIDLICNFIFQIFTCLSRWFFLSAHSFGLFQAHWSSSNLRGPKLIETGNFSCFDWEFYMSEATFDRFTDLRVILALKVVSISITPSLKK